MRQVPHTLFDPTRAGTTPYSNNCTCAPAATVLGVRVVQVGYNKDGVFLTFVQNCEKNQETATGALIYALPKWAVYKGATYFWSPVWTAWDVFDAVGGRNNDDYYPGAFVQMQPVIPQRAADVQADVTYFVSDVSDGGKLTYSVRASSCLQQHA